MNTAKQPQLEIPVHGLIAGRWSPYVFADTPVSDDDLSGVFQAARWAASAFNEQPWRYIVATKDQPEEYAKLLSCLVEANQVWAGKAPVLALAIISQNFERNGKPNGTALYDLGLASANLTLEAVARGLQVHQMAGILPDRAAEVFEVPPGYQVVIGLAMGYPGEPLGDLGQRDQAPRSRRSQQEFVFHGRFGQAFQSKE